MTLLQLDELVRNIASKLPRSNQPLSRPHPAGVVAALKSDAAQSDRSKHHRGFNDPNTATRLLEDNAARLRRMFSEQGVAQPDIDAYLDRLREPAALESALNWYRAASSGNKGLAVTIPALTVPTLYIWGDKDATVGRAAAEGTAQYVTGPYQFEVIPGAGHFLTDRVESQVTSLLVRQIRKYSP